MKYLPIIALLLSGCATNTDPSLLYAISIDEQRQYHKQQLDRLHDIQHQQRIDDYLKNK